MYNLLLEFILRKEDKRLRNICNICNNWSFVNLPTEEWIIIVEYYVPKKLPFFTKRN